MLRKLQNRLRAVLIAVFMAIVTLILAFSFQNTLQARKTADITYIQRMASLLIYELEADPESPTALLSYYERETQVYSILKDASGSVLFQSSPETSENLEALAEKASLSATHMSNIETGNSKLSLPTIVSLANALGVSVDGFLCDSVAHSKDIFSQEIQNLVSDCDEYEIRMIADFARAAKETIRKNAKWKA